MKQALAFLLIAVAMPLWAAVPAVNTAAFTDGAGSGSFTPAHVGAVFAGLLCVGALMLLGWYVRAGYESWANDNRRFQDLLWLGLRAVVIVTLLMWMVT